MEKSSLPAINGKESFDSLVSKLSRSLIKLVNRPLTFDELKHDSLLNPLVYYLHADVHHIALIHAILALRGHFGSLETDEDDINATRALACEALALKLVNLLSEPEKLDLLYELPEFEEQSSGHRLRQNESEMPSLESILGTLASESSPLLMRNGTTESGHKKSEYAVYFEGLNALEIAAISGAKVFLSQKPIQRIVDAIWKGDVVFWDKLSTDAVKHAQAYQRKTSDPFARIRVPMYLKAFEFLFFAAFLGLYYAVILQRQFHRVTVLEILLDIWLTSFAYNEFNEYLEAGKTFYLRDFWSLWDILIILIGIAFCVARVIGLVHGDDKTFEIAFDILSLMALFLVPRIFSLLIIHPYFGMLIPCLSAMTMEFIKFLSIIVVAFAGFLTTFCLLARGYFTVGEMAFALTQVFFGNTAPLELADKISPYLGMPLMLIFVTLTQMLLVKSLISFLTNSLTRVIDHAREEYLFVYSVYVLESSTSKRLTYFLPPFNLIPLALWPLRIFLSANTLRGTRIFLLKASHLPHVVAIRLYEKLHEVAHPDYQTGLHQTKQQPSVWQKSAKSLLANRRAARYPTVLPAPKYELEEEEAQSPTVTKMENRAKSQEDIKNLLVRLKTQMDHLSKLVDQQDEDIYVKDRSRSASIWTG
ncbi:hypothetical protein BDV97DRAFT_299440 [Delphinella strobiligena]|nr:hypothetical protein BDV97DRAFT_299440 [Delphinella strobiligena]